MAGRFCLGVAVETLCWLWTWIGTNHDAIQTILLVLGTLAAFLVIWHNGKISRREATIGMVDEQFGEEGDHYADFKDLMLGLEESGGSVIDFVIQSQSNNEGRDILLRQLNRYELVSLGIKQSVFDEQFYHRWFYSQLTKDYANLKPLIEGIRKAQGNDAYYCEFEDLAVRWNRKRHPVKHPPKWRILWWVITNQKARARNALRNR